MADTGWLSPSSVADNSGIGTLTWTNPGNAAAQDDTYATVSGSMAQVTHYLFATTFGASIPSGATIDGIEVGYDAYKSGGMNCAYSTVKLIKGGSVSGDNKGSSYTYTGTSDTDTYQTFGGASDLWGLTLTESDVEASNFGVAASFTLQSPSSFTLYADHVQLKIYYTESGGTTHALAGTPQASASVTGSGSLTQATWSLSGTAQAGASVTGSGGESGLLSLSATSQASASVTGSGNVWWSLSGTSQAGASVTGSGTKSGYLQLSGRVLAEGTIGRKNTYTESDWKSPGTLADDSGIGTLTWSDPGNAAAEDDTYASVSTTSAATTHYLKATNFGFSISNPMAQVAGVEVRVSGYRTGQPGAGSFTVTRAGTSICNGTYSITGVWEETNSPIYRNENGIAMWCLLNFGDPDNDHWGMSRNPGDYLPGLYYYTYTGILGTWQYVGDLGSSPVPNISPVTSGDEAAFSTIKLVKGGTIQGSNLGYGDLGITDADDYFYFGAPRTLWGLSLSRADVTSTSFGVAIALDLTPYATNPIAAYIDHIQMKVWSKVSTSSTSTGALVEADWGLSGTSQASATVTGSGTKSAVVWGLSATSQATMSVTGSGSLTQATWGLSGTPQAAAGVTGSGSLTQAKWALSATSQATASVTGNGTITQALWSLSATSQATAEVTGAGVAKRGLFATSQATISVTGSGSLTQAKWALSGTPQASVSVSGNGTITQATWSLSATSQATASVTGSGSVGQPTWALSATSQATASISGNGTITQALWSLSATSQATAEVTGSGTLVQAEWSLSATSQATVGMTGGGVRVLAIFGTPQASASVIGNGTISNPTWVLSGTPQATASASGSGSVEHALWALSGSPLASVTASGNGTIAQAIWSLLGTPQAAAAVTGSGSVTHALWSLSATSQATASMTGNGTISQAVWALVGSPLASASVTGSGTMTDALWALSAVAQIEAEVTGDGTLEEAMWTMTATAEARVVITGVGTMREPFIVYY